MNRSLKCALFLLLALAGLGASAQIIEEDTTTNQPFFKASKFSSKCYVGVNAAVVQILKNQAAGNFGTDLNWVVNHKFVISAIYDGQANQVQIQKIVAPGDPTIATYLKHQYVALGFSYILFDSKLFSFQPGLSGGWGRVAYTFNGGSYHDNFAELLPAVSATYNCTKYFRFGLGLNYRIAMGAKLNGLNDADISGIGGVVFIKVGTF